MHHKLTVALILGFSQMALAGNTIDCGVVKLVADGTQSITIGTEELKAPSVHAESSDGQRNFSVLLGMNSEGEDWIIQDYPQAGQQSTISTGFEFGPGGPVRTARLSGPGAGPSNSVLCQYE